MVVKASVSGKDGEEVRDSRWGRCGRPSGPSLPLVVQIIQDVGLSPRIAALRTHAMNEIGLHPELVDDADLPLLRGAFRREGRGAF